MKEEGGRGPDYVQDCTGRDRRTFSHGMILNSNGHYLRPQRYAFKICTSHYQDKVNISRQGYTPFASFVDSNGEDDLCHGLSSATQIPTMED